MAKKKYSLNHPKVIAKISSLVDMLVGEEPEQAGKVLETGDAKPELDSNYPVYEDNAIYSQEHQEEIGTEGGGYAPIPHPIDESETQGYAPDTKRVVEEDHSGGCGHEETVRLDDSEEELEDGVEVVKVYLNQPFKL